MSSDPRNLVRLSQGAAGRPTSTRTLQRMINRGELRGYRFGRLLFVDPEELDRAFAPAAVDQ